MSLRLTRSRLGICAASALVFLAALVSTSQLGPSPDAPAREASARTSSGAAPSTVTGIVRDATARELVIDTEDGTETLRVDEGALDVPHLMQHSTAALPIEVAYAVREGERYAVAAADVPPRTAAERRRAAGLPSKLDPATFARLRRGQSVTDVILAVGLPLYTGVAGRSPNELCWQWQQVSGPSDRYFQACFGPQQRVTTLARSVA